MDWLIVVAVIWCIVALPIGILIGKGIKHADRMEARVHQRSLVPCACGCRRLVPVRSTWDGYHGPGPVERPRRAQRTEQPWVRR